MNSKMAVHESEKKKNQKQKQKQKNKTKSKLRGKTQLGIKAWRSRNTRLEKKRLIFLFVELFPHPYDQRRCGLSHHGKEDKYQVAG